MVQRLLAARNERDSRLALFSSWAVIAFQFTLFLVIGLILYVYYGDGHLPLPKKLDRIYPQFIWDNLPPGVAGLTIAAILAAAMSNLSAALNALASTTIMDFLKPMATIHRTEQQYLRLAKWATVGWGIILFLIGLVATKVDSVLEAGLSIASIVYGALLGVFLLGILTKRVGEIAAMCGMTVGLLVLFYIKFGTPIAWTWYVMIGSSATVVTGYAASFLIREKQNV